MRQDRVTASASPESSSKSIFFQKLAALIGSDTLKSALNTFADSKQTLANRQTLLITWMKVAKGICPTLGGLLRACGAQLYSNAIGESNFSSVTRILSNQRLRTGGKLLAAQVLASRARRWAQFKDPSQDTVEKAKAKHSGIASYFPAASLPMGGVSQREEESSDDEVEAVDDVEAPSVDGASAIARSTTTTTTTSARTATSPRVVTSTATTTSNTRPQRANRGVRMEAILRVISVEQLRGEGRGGGTLDLEAGDENANSDQDYVC